MESGTSLEVPAPAPRLSYPFTLKMVDIMSTIERIHRETSVGTFPFPSVRLIAEGVWGSVIAHAFSKRYDERRNARSKLLGPKKGLT